MALHLTCAPPSDLNCVQMYTHEDPRVCVYGGSIDAYTAIAALTSSALSVPPERITLVLPPPSDEEDIFADPRVLSKVRPRATSPGPPRPALAMPCRALRCLGRALTACYPPARCMPYWSRSACDWSST